MLELVFTRNAFQCHYILLQLSSPLSTCEILFWWLDGRILRYTICVTVRIDWYIHHLSFCFVLLLLLLRLFVSCYACITKLLICYIAKGDNAHPSWKKGNKHWQGQFIYRPHHILKKKVKALEMNIVVGTQTHTGHIVLSGSLAVAVAVFSSLFYKAHRHKTSGRGMLKKKHSWWSLLMSNTKRCRHLHAAS